MDIKSISVEGFRCHTNLTVELGKVTLLHGPNGSGKSSIIEAVATVLLAENTWVYRQGVRLADLIQCGAKQARVAISGKRTISRIIKPKGSQLLLDDKEAITQPLLMKNLRANEQQLRAALIPQSFLNLDLKDQKDALFNLLGEKMTIKEVSQHVPASETWTKLATRWKEDNEDQETVDLDKLYEFCYEARRNYKAKRTAAPEQENTNQKDLVKRLSAISQKIATANFDNERIRAARKEKAELPAKQKELEKLEEQLKKATKLDDKIEALGDELNDLGRKVAAADAVLSQARLEAKKVASLNVARGKKVQCPIGLECPHDESVVKQKSQYLAGLATSKEGELKSIQAKFKAVQASLEEAKESAQTYDELKGNIRELTESISTIQARSKTEEPVDLEPLKKEKADIERQLNEAAKPVAQTPDDQKLNHLNDILQALDVHGIKTKVIQQEIKGLEAEINEALVAFGKWRIRFFLAEEFSPAIIMPGGNEFGVSQLSDGQRAILSLIIQDVFSSRSGILLVVVDNLDVLDRAVTVKFFETAVRLKSKVLVAMAQSESLAAMTLPAGVKVVSFLPPEAAPRADREQFRPRKGEKPPVEDIL